MTVTKRETTGRNASKRARKAGEVPAVIYGCKGEVAHISIVYDTLMPILLAPSKEVKIKYPDGREEAVSVKKVEYSSLHNTLLHVDFCRIAEKK